MRFTVTVVYHGPGPDLEQDVFENVSRVDRQSENDALRMYLPDSKQVEIDRCVIRMVTIETNPTTGLSFSTALWHLIKAGARIRRAGWNGKDMWICLGVGNKRTPADSFWNEHTRAFADENGGFAEVLPYIIMKTADGKILMGWLASQSDMLAEDWEIVE